MSDHTDVTMLERTLSEAKATLDLRRAELAEVDGEIASTEEELSQLDAKDHISQSDLLMLENVRRKLRRLNEKDRVESQGAVRAAEQSVQAARDALDEAICGVIHSAREALETQVRSLAAEVSHPPVEPGLFDRATREPLVATVRQWIAALQAEERRVVASALAEKAAGQWARSVIDLENTSDWQIFHLLAQRVGEAVAVREAAEAAASMEASRVRGLEKTIQQCLEMARNEPGRARATFSAEIREAAMRRNPQLAALWDRPDLTIRGQLSHDYFGTEA
jgi:hypothetical protein